MKRTTGYHWRNSLQILFLLGLTCCQPKQATTGDTATSDKQPSTFYNTKNNDDSRQQAKTITEYELPAPLTDRPELIIRREGYTTSYNATTKQPNWVAWHLTKNRTHGNATRNESAFMEDTTVPAPRATLDDYFNRGYDRGHMCPAADNKWNKTAMDESFLLTNICPQNHGLNKYEWNDVEMLCRDWAHRYGAIDIVCGPIFRNATPQRTLGRNKVWVPDAFFKVVLCRKGEPKAIGFVYDNIGRKMKMNEHIFTVDEIEDITGIDFFPALDDKTENTVEAVCNIREW